MILHYSFQFDSISSNVQAGDLAAMVLVSQQGAFETSGNSNITIFGEIISVDINTKTVIIGYDNSSNIPFPLVGNNVYIMFIKRSEVNKSSLTGYYAQVNLKNNSSEYVELFSAGSQVSESSK
tara:strand:- start:1296 stop:1664 length:369 start_codon:yes stop_codon:yes gene_type:complete